MLDDNTKLVIDSSCDTIVRACQTCKCEKSILEFTKNKNQPSGYMGYCKSCNNERNKRYRRDPDNLKKACIRIFGYIKGRVKKKKLDLDFGPDFLEDLYKEQNGLCAYTGDNLSLQAGLPSTLSVDRIDSNIGYTKDNVKLVTWEVNNAKQELSMNYFIFLCKKVINHG